MNWRGERVSENSCVSLGINISFEVCDDVLNKRRHHQSAQTHMRKKERNKLMPTLFNVLLFFHSECSYECVFSLDIYLNLYLSLVFISFFSFGIYIGAEWIHFLLTCLFVNINNRRKMITATFIHAHAHVLVRIHKFNGSGKRERDWMKKKKCYIDIVHIRSPRM